MRSIIIFQMVKQVACKRKVRHETGFASAPGSQAIRLRYLVFTLGGCMVALSISGPSFAEEPSISVKIRNHRFIPSEIEIPAGEKRLLVIENEDTTVEEFESHSLHREKIVPPLSKANVYVGPLKPGRYEFVGEFNEASAKGAVVAK
jgi:hypothetical protein